MPRFRFSYLTVAFLIFGFLFLAATQNSTSQETISLGCCKTVKGTPACVGCGDGDLNCAIDGSLCVETDFFELSTVCALSSTAGEAICQSPQSNGCCAVSQGNCTDDVSFDSCQGQHWFEVDSCSTVPMCSAADPSSGHYDRNIIMIVVLVVVLALVFFRLKRPRA